MNRESDSVYALITRKTSLRDKIHIRSAHVIARMKTTEKFSSKRTPLDVLTEEEQHQYNDEDDGVIVSKRDPGSAHPVRVGTMDFSVPEKLPQPRNYLESMVWSREIEVDIMRERFQLVRAISLARAAENKYPRRNLFQSIKNKVLAIQCLK